MIPDSTFLHIDTHSNTHLVQYISDSQEPPLGCKFNDIWTLQYFRVKAFKQPSLNTQDLQ